jgi:hypothetical protein
VLEGRSNKEVRKEKKYSGMNTGTDEIDRF